MAIIAEVPYIAHLSVGGTTFAYDFQVDLATDLEVYVDSVLTTGYTMTGLGNEAGGTVIINSPVAAGVRVVLRRAIPQTQPTDLITGGLIAAESLEDALDRLAMLIQDVHEVLSRIPTLSPYSATVLRNLLFPQPVPLRLLGWDALGTGLTLYDSALVQITVDPVSGRATGKTTVTVPTSAGASFLTAAGVFPAGCLGLGVTYRCTTSFSTENGLASLNVGMGAEEDTWGAALGITAPALSNAGQWRNYRPRPCVVATDAFLVANGGLFGGTGACKITGHWETYQADS